jgi:hypothetical protein
MGEFSRSLAPGTLDPLTKELVYMTEVIGPPAKRTVQYVDELCGLLPANALGRLVRGLFRPCTAASNTRRSNRLAGRSPQDQRASGKRSAARRSCGYWAGAQCQAKEIEAEEEAHMTKIHDAQGCIVDAQHIADPH